MVQESLTSIVLYDTAASKQKLGTWFSHFRSYTDTETIDVPDNLEAAIAQIKEEITNRSGDCPETFIQLLRDWSNAMKCATSTNTPLVGRMYLNLYRQLFSTSDWFEPMIVDDEAAFNEQFASYRSYVSNKYTVSMTSRNIQPYIVPGSQPFDGLPNCLFVIEGRRTAGFHRVKHNRKKIKTRDDLFTHLFEGYKKESPNGFHKRQAGTKWQQRELKHLKNFFDKAEDKNMPDDFREMVISLKISPDDPVTGFAFFRKNRESFLKRINPEIKIKNDSRLMSRVNIDSFLKKIQDLKDIPLDELFLM